jgi:PAS domain S-box-containing protein
MNELRPSMPLRTERSGLHQLLEAPPEFIELLPVAAYACDAFGHVLWFNRFAAELWGRAPRIGDDGERFCGSYRLHFDGREISRDETPMAHALRTGESALGIEAIVERPDGSRVWAMVHILPVKDESGRVIGAINCFHDTSGLHQIKDDLREKQDELEDFFENGAVALHIVSSEGIILRANRAELELLGYEPHEYIGRSIAEFHADSDTIDDILKRLSRGERIERYPARLKAKDGSVRHVRITSSVRYRDGRILNTRCFTQDVTAEACAIERVAYAEDRFRQLLEALPAAVYTTDAEGHITYYNKAAVEMSGREPELGTDKWCVTWRLYQPDGSPMPHDQCPMAVALKENRPVRNVEALAERPDGTMVPFLPYPTPLRDHCGAVVGAVNMLIDIGERKQAETRQIMLLRELNHRIKNNMQMLQALLTSAQRETSSADARAVLTDATQRLAAMAAAQQVLYDEHQPTSFGAKEFLESVCAAAQNAFTKKTSIMIEAASGELANDVAMPLALILNELLTNAVKHGSNGEHGKAIRVGLLDEGGTCRLWVQDGGPGFELSTAIRRRSSGLGLVNGLARQLGGGFEVDSSAGARCVVHFRKCGTAIS